MVVSYYFQLGGFENWTVCSRYLPHAYAVLKHESTGLKDEEWQRLLYFIAPWGTSCTIANGRKLRGFSFRLLSKGEERNLG